jgi:ABC-type branched-subunit amino acid transport system ATPase component
MVTANASDPGVVLSRLSKSYGHVHAVRSVDLVIAPGETVAILGPNGAGQTTTIEMVLGLTRPDAGSVKLFGQSPAEAVAAGGFVVKDAPPEQLADAIRRVAAGERVVDPVLAAATLASGVSPLTARERDVLVAARPGDDRGRDRRQADERGWL